MKITVRYFNMVELALAMAVLAIGISSILVLFPVGINASTNARANDQVPMIADVVLEHIKNIALVANKNDWSSSISASVTIPTAKPDATDIENAVAGTAVMGNLYSTNKNGIFIYKNSDDFSASVCFWRDSTNYYQEFKIGSVSLDATDQPALNKIAAVIYVEISWPADAPYSTRVDAGNVRTYRLELFNQEAQ